MTFDNKYGNAIEYLLAKGNVAVRYRVMTELLDNAGSEDIHKLQSELIISERYVKLIDCLKKRKEYHGATIYAIENSLNMLVDMGCVYDSGFDEFDQVVKEIADEMGNKQIDNNHVLRYLPHIVAISSLLRAGIYDDYLMEFVKDRIGTIYDFAVQKRYDIYGWDPKPTVLSKEFSYNSILLKMDLLGRFFISVNSEWFAQAVELINRYVDADGIYKFPKNYLTEKDSCWILGNHMGLGENRRQKNALTIEGTFRALKILKIADMTKASVYT